MFIPPSDFPGLRPGKPLFQCFLLGFGLLLAVCLVIPAVHAQTAWNVNSTPPTNLTANAKLKFASNAFRLVWQQTSFYPVVVSTMEVKDKAEIPTPYSLGVSYQNMGVAYSPVTRKLTIRYVTSSGEYQAVVQDGSTLSIPNASHTRLGPGQAVTGFVVLSATYGTTTSTVDVLNVFRGTKNIALSPSVSIFEFNDFTYDSNGLLLLFGGGYSAAMAYPISSSPSASYQTARIDSSSSGLKFCGAQGNGKLAVGGASSSYYSSSADSYLSYIQATNGYSSYPTWYSPSIAAGFQVRQMIYEGGKFVAVGARYSGSYTSNSVGAVLVSTDGVEWTTIAIIGTTSLESVCRDGSKWVVAGSGGAVLTSTNGFEWTRYTVPGNLSLLSVASANGYCAVGSSTGKILTTTDFSTWNTQVSASAAVNCLAAGNGKFMALAGTTVYQSPFSAVGVADILTQPASAFIVPQQSVTLSVGAVGGNLAYQWYQGNAGDVSQPIADATGPTYQTPPLAAGASYWVRVSNGVGSEDSLTAVIVMQTSPVIISQPSSKQFEMGSSASTSVTVEGNKISYQWFQGYSGDTSAPLAGKTSATLTLPSDVPGVKYYWVTASNDLGSVNSIAVRVEVIPAPPAIIDQPLDVTTYVGSYTSINVNAGGASLSYQWFAGNSGDTSHLTGGTSSYFNPLTGFPGTYRYWVRVSNSLGFVDSRTSVYQVIPHSAPVITRQPYDVTTYVGSGDYVVVEVNESDVECAWYAGESGDTSILVDDYILFSPPTTVPGTYRYWARVSNSSGSVDSIAVTFTVKPQETGLISKHPLNKSIVRSSSTSLSVTASGSGLSYQWYSGASGDMSAPLSGSTSSSYSPPTDTVGQKSYWVSVTSGTTVQNSQTAVVTVIPTIFTITQQPKDGSTLVGDSLYCYAYCQGTNVTYQWYSGVSGDTSAPLANQTSDSLSVPATTAGAFSYWLRATSGSESRDSRAAVVKVFGRPPYFRTQPAGQQVVQGSGNVSLSVSLDDTTGATYQWYRGASGDTSVPLSSQSTSLSISSPLAGNYSYWVRATNPYGMADSRTATVLVTPANYSNWLVQNGLPSSGTGSYAPGASYSDDGVANLLKYAMGLRASDRFNGQIGPQMGSRTIGSSVYLTLRFTQAQAASGSQLFVEESTNLGTWTTTAVECGPSYDNGDGTMTRTFRTSQPIRASGAGYLRLKGSSN